MSGKLYRVYEVTPRDRRLLMTTSDRDQALLLAITLTPSPPYQKIYLYRYEVTDQEGVLIALEEFRE